MITILSYDVGTTSVKTCLFQVDRSIHLIASAACGYSLTILPDGGAEQDAEEWWQGMCTSTAEVLKISGVDPASISAISFCSQMQGLVLVDAEGTPVRPPMSYMDQRAKEEIREGIAYGLQVAGANIFKLIPSLIITGAVSSSVKDPVWKCKWVEKHEPENFRRAVHWLDVKDYLTSRCTGRFTMTADSAFGTLIYDTRRGREGWSQKMCSMFHIRRDLLPEIIRSTDLVGPLTKKSAAELGLAEGIPVYGGGGDSSLIGIGAGCVKPGDTHIYSGTSGWVITVTDRQMVDVNYMIAAITGAQEGRYNYFAEMETAGKSVDWACQLLLPGLAGHEKYRKLDELLLSSVPGAHGVVFAPWLHGNRCPFEDPDSTAVFFGLRLETEKADLLRAVVEGVLFHLRWMLECQGKKLTLQQKVRFVGGSAGSAVICQMLADVTGCVVETVESPQNVGAFGAAAVAAVGLGQIASMDAVQDFIPASAVYTPDAKAHAAYQNYFDIFCRLYSTNRKLFRHLG